MEDLPADKILIAYIKEAARLNLPIPPALAAALKKNKKAAATFDNFAPSHRREYVEWIHEAKTEDTRNRRVETTIEVVSEGKGRNWKYEKKK